VAKSEVVVLGAGIVGVSVAAHLQKRGISTTLIDRRGAGEETSYGNAGQIESSRMLPIAFPHSVRALARHAFGLAPESNFHWSVIPGLIPFLVRYWAASGEKRLEATARALRPMLAASAEEHEALVTQAGRPELIKRNGWLKIFRTDAGLEETAGDRKLADEYGVPYEILGRDAVIALEPHLRPEFKHGVYWPGTGSSPNPGALVKSYAALFEKLGGVFVHGDARTLHSYGDGFRVETEGGPVDAKIAVIALGPWSMDVAEKFGVRAPFAYKRGYHMHFAPAGNAALSRAVLDIEGGYMLAPMDRGIRHSTGVEFADRDAAPTPVQLERTEPDARKLFPLAEKLDANPWMGSRPAVADSLPIIGWAPSHPKLMLAFGHAHLGFTLGPPTGRMVADMIEGKKPFLDPAPFRPGRF
jgi:D-amino-acid dehydrogenase